jgi:hypothetical protein
MCLSLVENIFSHLVLSAGLPLAAVLLSGCPSVESGPSDSEPASEPSFDLTVGTGRDAFEVLDSRGTLVLERGPQGLQHVYVSLRAPITEGFHAIDIAIESEGRLLSAPTRVNAPFVAEPEDQFVEMVGQIVVVPDPNGFTDGAPATLRARLESRSRGFGMTERVIHLRW